MRTDRPAFAIEAGVLVLSTLCGCAVLISCAGAAPEPRSGSEAGPIVSSAEANETLDDADLALARGQIPAAEHAYLSVLEARPEDPRALAGLTRVALADGDFEAALGYDDRVRTGGPEVPGQLGARERCALWLAAGAGRVESGAGRAWDLIDRIEADPACPRADLPELRAQAFLVDARAAHGRDELEAALVACRLANEADSSLPDADLAAARWLLDAGRRRDALSWLGVALERHPDAVGLQQLMLEALGVPEP